MVSTSTPLLRAKRLSKSYGSVRALDEASFEVLPGVTGLLGPNGAGKSTAIRIFLGLLEPSGGVAEVMGSASVVPESRMRLGYMPEHDCLPSNQTAAYFLTLMAEISGIPSARSRALAADTLRHVGMFEERYRPISTYSTGMKQRVKLAQALVHDPALVLLDEPTAGLDPSGRGEMLTLIRKIHQEFEISIMLSSHLMQDVERSCDRIILIDSGRVVRSEEVAKLTEETETIFVEVTARRDEFGRALSRRGIDYGLDDRSIVVSDVNAALFDEIRDALVESEAPLRRMTPRRRALLDLFRNRIDGR